MPHLVLTCSWWPSWTQASWHVLILHQEPIHRTGISFPHRKFLLPIPRGLWTRCGWGASAPARGGWLSGLWLTIPPEHY